MAEDIFDDAAETQKGIVEKVKEKYEDAKEKACDIAHDIGVAIGVSEKTPLEKVQSAARELKVPITRKYLSVINHFYCICMPFQSAADDVIEDVKKSID